MLTLISSLLAVKSSSLQTQKCLAVCQVTSTVNDEHDAMYASHGHTSLSLTHTKLGEGCDDALLKSLRMRRVLYTFAMIREAEAQYLSCFARLNAWIARMSGWRGLAVWRILRLPHLATTRYCGASAVSVRSEVRWS